MNTGKKRSGFSFLAALGTTALALALAGQSAAAHDPNDSVSASEAKRIVRHYLTTQGFSRTIGPGGAKVGRVQLQDGIWVVQVNLRGSSASSIQRHNLYVNARSGRLSAKLPAPTPTVAAR